MGEHIRTALEGGVQTVTLARPEARNAMSRAMIEELLAALREAEASDDVRVLVLRGEGGHFCAGGDIKDMAKARMAPAELSGAQVDADPVAALNGMFGRIALAWARTPLPTVAVLEGAVMGGGFGVACTADVAIATTTADFRLPETSLGVIPAQIAPFLIERLGYSEAKRLAVTGARLDADAALKVGLVHHVCEPDALEDVLGATLRQILRCAPRATAETKRLLHTLYEGVTEAQIDHAARAFSEAARGDEAAEGMSAFIAKRKPSWAPTE